MNKKNVKHHRVIFLFVFIVLISMVAWMCHRRDITVANVQKMIISLDKKEPAPMADRISKKKAVHKATLVTQEEGSEKPVHFNFYDELPKTQWAFSQDASRDEETKTEEMLPEKKLSNVETSLSSNSSEVDQLASPPAHYVLQMGMFHHLDAANRYQAALLSAGLKVEIVKIREGKEISYRLQQGPYARLDQLKMAKKRLEERGVTSSTVVVE